MNGYMDRLLRVDLSRNKCKVDKLKEVLTQRYIGGSGLGAHFVYSEVGSADPLGPDNKIYFLTGPLTGTMVPFTGRFEVCSRSPLTGIWAESSCGGFWGAELKFSGFDGVIISGRSTKPVYLTIFDGKAELHDAKDLWGKDTYETEDYIKETYSDKKIRVVSIGPAGERLAKIAAIIADKGHIAGRSGLGAVMGSKKLKAIAVRGNEKVNVAKPDELIEIRKHVISRVNPKGVISDFSKYGTSSGVEFLAGMSDMPAKNWRDGVWDAAKNVTGQRMFDTILTNRASCYGCAIGCKRVVKVSEGPFSMDEGAGPEYETIAALGSLCLNDNLESIAKANDLCNRYGLDTMSTGSTVAFVMECYEKGILNKNNTNGLDMKWGNSDSIVKLVQDIGERKGLGNILGEGVLRASEKISKGSEKFAQHIKGLEVPFHDPRAQNFIGLELATSNRGACHLQSFAWMFSGVSEDEEYLRALNLSPLSRFKQDANVANVVFVLQNLSCIIGSLVMCHFPFYYRLVTIPEIVGMFNSVTGKNVSFDDLLLIGERIFNIKRAYNNMLGVTRKNDTLPHRILKEPLKEGSAKGRLVNIPYLLDQYYTIRGWTKNGIPTQERLRNLGLKHIANKL